VTVKKRGVFFFKSLDVVQGKKKKKVINSQEGRAKRGRANLSGKKKKKTML